jgi:hypothetical protein
MEVDSSFLQLGRGGMTNHHVVRCLLVASMQHPQPFSLILPSHTYLLKGNMHFRTLVSSFRLHYCAAKKGDKGRLSKKLTNFVRHKNGRFLQKDEADNLWYEVGDNRAHGKCAQGPFMTL